MEELVGRLNKIFFGQFGCQFSYIADTNLSIQEWGAEALLRAKTGSIHRAEHLTVGLHRLGFVVRTRGRFAGLAVVNNFKGEKNTKFFDMTEFAVALIEDHLSSEDKPQILRRAEENVILQQEQKNVIPLRPKNIVNLSEFYPELQEQRVNLTSTLIIAKKGFPFQRLGLDVHVRAARVAFLSMNDLPAESFNSADSIHELGSITIFIEDITAISMERQEQLAAYLRTNPTEDSPVFLVCGMTSIEDMIGNGVLLPELSRLLTNVRIPWNPQDMDSAAVRKAVRIVLDQSEASAPVDTHFVPFNVQYLDEEQPTFH